MPTEERGDERVSPSRTIGTKTSVSNFNRRSSIDVKSRSSYCRLLRTAIECVRRKRSVVQFVCTTLSLPSLRLMYPAGKNCVVRGRSLFDFTPLHNTPRSLHTP
ncbi:unnamed protein product, partial [Ectocarpus sp. 6 AP-2014]